jgi:predicted aspartyl protease
MATGAVDPEGRPTIRIEHAGREYEAIVDTGFESGLQLPDGLFTALSPRLYREVKFQLGGGQDEYETKTYKVWCKIDSDAWEVEAFFAATDEILIGLELLRPYRLTIDFPAGTVLLERP